MDMFYLMANVSDVKLIHLPLEIELHANVTKPQFGIALKKSVWNVKGINWLKMWMVRLIACAGMDILKLIASALSAILLCY